MADKKPALEKITSPRGVAKYPRLNEPDTKFNDKGVYSVKLIFSRESVQPLLEKLSAAAEKAFVDAKASLEAKLKAATKGEEKGKLKKELVELKKADLPTKPVFDDEGNETDDVEINFKMNASRVDKKTQALIQMRPTFFDMNGEKIEAKAVPSIWGGSILKASAQINPFYTAKAGAGVGLRLSAVQIIKLVSGGGGRAEDHGFGKEEDGDFEAGSAPAAAAPAPKAAGEESGGGEDESEF